MKTALIVIDYIKGIIDGPCKAFAGDHPIVANMNRLISKCRYKKSPFIMCV
jgi:nicotinamidase-related amidase